MGGRGNIPTPGAQVKSVSQGKAEAKSLGGGGGGVPSNPYHEFCTE